MVVDEMLGGGIQVFSYFAKVMCDIIAFTKKKKKSYFLLQKWITKNLFKLPLYLSNLN